MNIHRTDVGSSTSWTVASRFCLRLAILAGFAAASAQPFWAVLATLLLVAAALSTILAAVWRERLLGPVLTHWDEAVLYALLSRGVVALSPSL